MIPSAFTAKLEGDVRAAYDALRDWHVQQERGLGK
jgi:hypothetical protein